MAALKKVFNIGSNSDGNEDLSDKNDRLDKGVPDGTEDFTRNDEKPPQKASESQENITIEGGKSPIIGPIDVGLGKDLVPLIDEKHEEDKKEGEGVQQLVSGEAHEASSVIFNVTSDQTAPNSNHSNQTVESTSQEVVEDQAPHEEESVLEASTISNEVVPPEEEEDMIRDDVRDDIICMIFDLPKTTKFYRDFSCAIASSFAMHGRMYPANGQICFYSNVFGRERKILIPYESITSISKTRAMMFQNAIKINTNTGEEYTFTSFWGNNCEKCHDLIVKIRNRVLGLTSSTVTIPSPDMSPVLSPVGGESVPQASLSHSEEEAVISSSSSNNTVSTGSPSIDETSLSAENGSSKLNDDGSEGQEQQKSISEEVVDTEASDGGIQEKETSTTADTKKDVPSSLPVKTLGAKRNSVSDIGSAAPKDLAMVMLLEERFDLSADEFMDRFLMDNAPFSLEEFNRRAGSSEITCHSWKTPTEITQDNNMGRTRSLQFRVPVDAPIGPKSTMVDVLQCHKKSSDGTHVIETSTRLVDIPYGDYFSVEDRWTITSTSGSTSMLRIELKVVFSKSTFWKSKIESRAKSENKQKHERWVQMAKEFLINQTNPPALSSEKFNQANDMIMSPPPSKAKTSGTAIKSPQPNTPSNRRSLKRNGIQNLSPQELKRFQKKVLLPWFMLLIMLIVVIHLHLAVSRMEKSLDQTLYKLDQLQQTLEHFYTPESKRIPST